MSENAAEIIVVGGTIHTGDPTVTAKAFAVCGGRFAAVGSVADVMILRGPRTEVIDLGTSTVLPGLVDSHLHLTNLGLRLEQVDLVGVRSPEELIERTAGFAENSSNDWILGRGWDENLWPGAGLPTEGALSAALGDRPVALARVDGHALLANARALRLAGIDASTPDPAGGRILRDAGGKPTGVLVDSAQELVYDRVPQPSHEQLLRALRNAIAQCNRWGVTAVGEPGCDDAALSAQKELLESGEFSIRNYAMLHDEPALIEKYARAGPTDGAYDGRLWVRAIKMYADGALGSRGAALLAPYSDDPTNVGLIVTPPEHIEAVAASAFRTGFQPCVHAIGDRANRVVLDLYESALARVDGNADLRPRIEHAQVIAAGDVPRFARLGVIPAMQATHALSDMPWVPSRLGERSRDAYPWRLLLDAGSILANGTDAPVEPVSTARTFYASVGGHRNAEQHMTRREALASMTIWAAYANFQERAIGSIARGKYADFVVMDRDWMTVAPETVLETQIFATYVGGRRVYDANATSRSDRRSTFSFFELRGGCGTHLSATDEINSDAAEDHRGGQPDHLDDLERFVGIVLGGKSREDDRRDRRRQSDDGRDCDGPFTAGNRHHLGSAGNRVKLQRRCEDEEKRHEGDDDGRADEHVVRTANARAALSEKNEDR
jgi:predicted amidohydrolase YtcJ